MEENLSYQKRTKTFVSLSVIASTVLYLLLTMLTKNLETEVRTLSSELTLRLPVIAVTVIVITLLFLIGKKLTGDKQKAIIFMASVFFGESAVSAVTGFLSCAIEALVNLKCLTYDILSLSDVVIAIIEIPFAIILACYAFSAFEGLNPRLCGQSLFDSQMTLSRARTRFIAYELIGSFVIGIFASLPTFLISMLTLQEFNDVDGLTVISANASSAFSVFAGLVLIYVAGYRAYKSRIDAMAFVACYALSTKIANIFINIIVIPQVLSLYNLTANTSEDLSNLSGILEMLSTTGIFTVLTTAVSIIIPLIMMKHFFSQEKITLFDENADFSVNNESADATSPTEETDDLRIQAADNTEE